MAETTAAAQASQPAAADEHRRWIALYVLCTGMLMIVLDVTVVNGYLIPFGGLLLLAGRFGDILGRKDVFMAGLGVFTVASLLCGVAESQGLLVAARFVIAGNDRSTHR